MKNIFHESGTPGSSEAEQAMKSWGIQYEKKPDGTLFVPGNFNISGKNLIRLPDLSSVSVDGDFYCYNNQLTSLEGAPQSVGGNFACDNNRLTSLKHGPQSVGGGFFCDKNQLTSLEHAPQSVGGIFSCDNNRITSLEHAPQAVSGNFFCSSNQLTSLEHAPQSVSGEFYCSNNRLTSLEHAPQTFKKLTSDFGKFASWDEVPEQLRLSPETKARLLEQQRERSFTQGATELQSPLRVRRPLKLKPDRTQRH
jgi:hypothetical protein